MEPDVTGCGGYVAPGNRQGSSFERAQIHSCWYRRRQLAGGVLERRHSNTGRLFSRVPSQGAWRSIRYMSENLIKTPGVFSGGAIAALAVGLMSIASFQFLSSATLPLGVVALVLGLVSRRALRADPSLRGARLSLAGFLLGIVGMFLGGAVPVLLMLLWRFFGWGD